MCQFTFNHFTCGHMSQSERSCELADGHMFRMNIYCPNYAINRVDSVNQCGIGGHYCSETEDGKYLDSVYQDREKTLKKMSAIEAEIYRQQQHGNELEANAKSANVPLARFIAQPDVRQIQNTIKILSERYNLAREHHSTLQQTINSGIIFYRERNNQYLNRGLLPPPATNDMLKEINKYRKRTGEGPAISVSSQPINVSARPAPAPTNAPTNAPGGSNASNMQYGAQMPGSSNNPYTFNTPSGSRQPHGSRPPQGSNTFGGSNMASSSSGSNMMPGPNVSTRLNTSFARNNPIASAGPHGSTNPYGPNMPGNFNAPGNFNTPGGFYQQQASVGSLRTRIDEFMRSHTPNPGQAIGGGASTGGARQTSVGNRSGSGSVDWAGLTNENAFE